MSQHENLEVSVTLRQDSWMAILEILRCACQLRGGSWIQWEQGIEYVVLQTVKVARWERSQELRRLGITDGWDPSLPFGPEEVERMEGPGHYILKPDSPMGRSIIEEERYMEAVTDVRGDMARGVLDSRIE